MNRSRIAWMSIASLGLGIVAVTPESSLGFDYGYSWGAAYAPAYTYSANYGGYATSCCRPTCCPTDCCTSCCASCSSGDCAAGSCSSGCASGGCSTNYEPTPTGQQTYYPPGRYSSRPFVYAPRSSSPRTSDRRTPAVKPRGAAAPLVSIPPAPSPVRAAMKPIPARVAQKAPVRLTAPAVRQVKESRPAKLNSDWTPVEEPKIAVNR